jgi:hypothetical protein
MTGDDMMRPQRRFSQRNAEQGIKFGGKTEHVCSQSTVLADAFHFDRMCEWWKRLKPPSKVQR